MSFLPVLQVCIPLWPLVKAKRPEGVPADVPAETAPGKRKRAVKPVAPEAPAPAPRPRIEMDGSEATVEYPLPRVPTIQAGSDARLQVGGTTHYARVTLLLAGSAERAESELRLGLPIRAKHTTRGEGYLGLVLHLPASRKCKPLFLPCWMPPPGEA